MLRASSDLLVKNHNIITIPDVSHRGPTSSPSKSHVVGGLGS
ncbi:hypothetical protein SLEP1_g29472 [Rubroshorea leprosula]|uniref:Uncharacterized protein n=1 Tax=Rubroshorea leprosula TaxID=152421 RepID=A0AAV5K8H1_9ROSI|nr:hypothetical protein SLEP1_g29472 [Rubroshorea leprosula]